MASAGRRDGGDDGVRHGRRQGRRALGLALVAARLARGLLPGVGPRRAATARRPAACCSTRPPIAASSPTSSASPRSAASDVNALLALIAGRADGDGRFAVALDGLGERARALVAVAERIGAVELEPGRVDEARGTLRLRAVGHRRASEVETRVQALRAPALGRAGGDHGVRDGHELPARACCCGTSAMPHEPAPAGRCCDICEPPGDLATGGIDVAALREAVLAAAAAARPAVGRTGLDQILRGLDRVRERYGGGARVRQRGGPRPRRPCSRRSTPRIAEGELISSGGARPVLRPPGGGDAGRCRRRSRRCGAGRAPARLAPRARAQRRRSGLRGAHERVPRRGLPPAARRRGRAARSARPGSRAHRALRPATCSNSFARPLGRGLRCRPCPYDAPQ